MPNKALTYFILEMDATFNGHGHFDSIESSRVMV
jgi:hypothetical protein